MMPLPVCVVDPLSVGKLDAEFLVGLFKMCYSVAWWEWKLSNGT